jgi:hypothetical protein
MRFCKLDWKPDTGREPVVISGSREVYRVLPGAVLDEAQRGYLSVTLALLAKEIGIEEGRLDAMVEAGGLGEVLVKVGG